METRETLIIAQDITGYDLALAYDGDDEFTLTIENDQSSKTVYHLRIPKVLE
jgi:hypothetical protein